MKCSFAKSCAILSLVLTILFITTQQALALREGRGATWSKTTRVQPDAKAGGWYINLGITGARAMIPDDQPKVLVVKYVFEETPAYGKLKDGDVIVGVNGKPFVTPHKFGYGVTKFGYEGPIMDFGNALEESQGKLKGKMTIDVTRGDKKETVELTLPTKYGSFSATYPYNCEKTDKILAESCEYILKRQGENGLWSGRVHLNAFCTLALMASGEEKYMPAVKKAIKAMADQTSAEIHFRGHPCWQNTLYGTCLAEYYLLTGEKWVLPELEEINQWIAKAQAPRGGWGHAPWSEERPNGYGPINCITSQAMLAWGLMQRCGLKVDPKAYHATHDFVAKGTNKIGYVWYKDGGAGNPKYADMGRTGISALAHYVDPIGGKKYKDFALLNADCIGNNPKTLPDTHGSPILGMVWTGLGAQADPKDLRKLLDYSRWCFAMAQCPDGTFYYQPNRDNNPQDYAAAPRLSATAATALILSLKNKKLQITGAELKTAK